MNAINDTILTWILLVPIAGALLIAILPDRAKLSAWLALAVSLVTFGLTLHLPAHFIVGQPGFQYEINKPWIQNPAIFYHLGIDGLSLWMVVLTGLLAPVGVLASWNAIQDRRKVFYSLFMVQQTAMFGVFMSLDLMVYYGFWELSLVPLAILIAMYGRKEGGKAATKFFLFAFIPSAPLLVAILWLYARTGTFNFAELQVLIAHGALPAGPLFWVALAFLVAGVFLVARPAAGTLTLTLMLGFFFVVQGAANVVGSIVPNVRGRGWMLFNGLVSFVLGILIWTGLPSSAAWAIGLLVGIYLIFDGWALMVLAWEMHSHPEELPRPL